MTENLEYYRHVCSQLVFFCKRMDDTFRLFIQLSTAVIGGFIWLKMQPGAKDEGVSNLFPVARWIIPVLAFATIVQIMSDLKSWWGYRNKEVALNPEAPKPKLFWSGRLEYILLVITAVVGGAAYCLLK